MKKKTLALVHTVNWYAKVINEPFADPWLKENIDVEITNIMDDSLLRDSLPNLGPTTDVIRRLIYYFMAAEASGADVIMSTCTTMGKGTRLARELVNVPLFNIDEPMAEEAIRLGSRFGVLATVPTSAPATRYLLNAEAEKAGKTIEIKTVINEAAFAHRQQGQVSEHDALVHQELDKLQHDVDAIVLGQISLAQVVFAAKVPVLQVGRSGFARARELLDG